jgi:hypothetical protein
MTVFRREFGLESLNFKQIDKFIYLDGGESPASEQGEP